MGGKSRRPSGRSSEYSIEPFLEGSTIETDGRIEISIFVSGSGQISENELDVFLKQHSIDPGERIELGVFVSGVDDVDENELSLFHGHDEVIDVTNPGVVRRNLNTDVDVVEPTDEAVEQNSSGLGGAEHVHPVVFPDEDGEVTADYALEGRSLEGNTNENPAYIFEINTRETAPAGEYSLPVIFTYHSEDGVKQVKTVPSVQINNWRERWEPWVTRGAVVAVLLVVLGGLFWVGLV
ncbi:hypothetical protein [Natronobacterium gregoryi]|uniref:DUF8164 domain-containing protein n=2 Tax=Natronobacterium gregoryi TaxID=44930 RepID=L0AJN1_NATGS|nr:hypothetical protein [Natronobacterium gregoryi]AFZ74021.1 hypothetical protein Natgr_2880 [Natronobacterium gregoryi SP2]ELY70593.1 hypothetical protein C490_06449 [Natronobacterium gregoryi SP2]PLK20770.1 hypothetical protein CYV19_07595 [Natronobacterium gregoryi SP2]SFJ07523.1 hypothetical protein SAMN05443661_11361 [Natronobacterium gregoryi]